MSNKRTINAGKIKVTFEGNYNSEVSYRINTVIKYENIAYITKKDNVPAGTLPTNTQYFDVFFDFSEIEDKVDKVEGKGLITNPKPTLLSWLNAVNENYSSDIIETALINFLALTADRNIYGYDEDLWASSNTSTLTKTYANVGKYLEPATDSVCENTNYSDSFKSIRCNAYVDDDGVQHITAIEGMKEFKDTGKVDVFSIFRTPYEKDTYDATKHHYAMKFIPTEGYTPHKLAIQKDGTVRPYILIPTFLAGAIDDNGTRKLYGSKGLIPAHYLSNATGSVKSDSISYSALVTHGRNRGQYYTGGLESEYAFLKQRFWLMMGTKHSQSVLAGNFNNNQQVAVSVAESDVHRVVLTNAQASNFDLKTYVSVGDRGTATSNDRNNGYMHNLANVVRIIGKETVDADHTALILDCDNFTISNASTTYVSTMYERSGYSDEILGQTGSIGSNTNGKHGAVFCGVEIFQGIYEVSGNAIMDIVDSNGTRDVYVCNDATKLSTDINTIKANYTKISNQIKATNLNAHNYITEERYDIENGIIVPTESGQSGSGSAVGYADSLYVDAGTSGQREFLRFGNVFGGAFAGLSRLLAGAGLGHADWTFGCRLSINAVGGELSA